MNVRVVLAVAAIWIKPNDDRAGTIFGQHSEGRESDLGWRRSCCKSRMGLFLLLSLWLDARERVRNFDGGGSLLHPSGCYRCSTICVPEVAPDIQDHFRRSLPFHCCFSLRRRTIHASA